MTLDNQDLMCEHCISRRQLDIAGRHGGNREGSDVTRGDKQFISALVSKHSRLQPLLPRIESKTKQKETKELTVDESMFLTVPVLYCTVPKHGYNLVCYKETSDFLITKLY